MQVGLYIHIPFCSKKCSYCNFYSVPVTGQNVNKLCDCLITEIKTKLDDDIDTIYIGGGSPSCIGPALIDLIKQINHITGRQVPEFTVEINPTQAVKELFDELLSNGVNRISIGAQSFEQAELDLLDRDSTPQIITDAVTTASKSGFDNISLDLIFAIPNQTLLTWSSTLKKAIELPIKHISAYSLSFEKDTALSRMLKTEQIKKIDEEIDMMMYENTIDILRENGFSQYEISNFSIAEFECEHNLKYWNNTEYLGIGPAAGSYYKNQRTMNFPEIKKYVAAIETGTPTYASVQIPNQLEFACETAVLGLRKIKGINLSEYYDRTGYDFMQLFEKPVNTYAVEKLLLVEPKNVRLSRKALPIADNVLADFSFV